MNAAQDHEVWYHGLSPHAREHVHQHGLSAPPGVNPATWPMLTDSREQAATYAHPGGSVLEYHIPKHLTNYRNEGAVLWPASSHNVYGHDARAAGIKGTLGNEHLVAEHPVLETTLHTSAQETIEETLDRLRREEWQPIRDAHQSVHRGLGTELSDEDHAVVHDPSRPMHERATRLMQHIAQGHTREDYGWGGDLGGSGLGVHWTTDSNVAHHFSKIDASHRVKYDEDADPRHGHNADGFPRQRPETRVVLHAHFPEHEHVAHEEDDQDGAFGWDVRNQLQHTENGGGVPGGYEREVPIKRGKPVRVHAISWGLASHRTDDPAPHDRETTRYDFPETQHHQAMRYVRNPQSSAQYGDFGEQYGQHVEPAGRYLSEQSGDHVPEGWESGEVHFRNPLHLPFGGGYREPDNWKHQLSRRYDGATGEELSRAVVADGHDGIITHDKYGTSEIVDLTHLHRQMHGHTAARFLPHDRIFGPTFGLDKRLFTGERLKPDVRTYVLSTLGAFWSPRYGSNWTSWARVYLAGSQASEWTSQSLVGNNDFDILIGVHYDRARESSAALAQLSDVAMTDRFNREFREFLQPHTDPVTITIDGRPEGPFSNTWYCNADSWDIRDIKPYAAYEVVSDRWWVKPPHLPEWSIHDFPQGPGLLKECQSYATIIRAVLAEPEPFRSQRADGLWHFLHGDRSRAFGPDGEGWWDAGNVVEKFLDQMGLWEPLAEAHFATVADPRLLCAPARWSNDPRQT